MHTRPPDCSGNTVSIGILPLKAELKGDIGELRTEMRGSIAAVKGEIGVLREEINSHVSSLETKMIKWIVGTVIGAGGVCFSVARFFL
jgi:hypothetical protein